MHEKKNCKKCFVEIEKERFQKIPINTIPLLQIYQLCRNQS